MKFLLDMNVISEARRPNGNPQVRARLAATAPEDKFLSVVTIGEIAAGTAKLDPGPKRRELQTWLAQAEQFFADQLLPVNRDIA